MNIYVAFLGAVLTIMPLWLTVRIINRGKRRPFLSRKEWLMVRAVVCTFAVGAVCIAVMIYVRHCRQMRAIAAIERLGGSVLCHTDIPDCLFRLQPDENLGSRSKGMGYPLPNGLGPNWVRRWLPAKKVADHVWIVDTVWLDNGPGQKTRSFLTRHYDDPSWSDSVEPVDGDLALLATLTDLETLYLRDTGITDTGVGHLRNLRNITSLSLGYTQITDGSLEIIAGFEKLETLRLCGTNITDAGLAKLYGLKHLTELDVRDTHVTKVGLAPFLSRPGLDVMFFDPDSPQLQFIKYY